MSDVIQLFGRGKTATLSETKKKAYAFKDKCAEQIAHAGMANGVEPHDMIEPFMQFVATLVAMAKVTGKPVDVDALLKAFPGEVTEMTKLMLARTR